MKGANMKGAGNQQNSLKGDALALKGKDGKNKGKEGQLVLFKGKDGKEGQLALLKGKAGKDGKGQLVILKGKDGKEGKGKGKAQPVFSFFLSRPFLYVFVLGHLCAPPLRSS